MLFKFVFFLHGIGAAQRPSFIYQNLLLLLFNGKPLVVGFTSIKRCKSSSNTQKSLLMVLKPHSCVDLQAVLKIFRVNFVVVVVVVVT